MTTQITHEHANYTMILRDGRRIDVLPTPALLDESGRRFPEAYESDPATERYPAIWRVRDDSYDPPGTEYAVVDRIERKR